jgi:LacI family transcriptional regulator
MHTQPGAAHRPKVTLKFLAEHLGLSRTTISIVLNNAARAETITEATRDRILEAARHFDYKPNFIGRSLHTGRSYLIGVISPDLSEGYTSTLLAGIEHHLLESEYQFFVASHHWSLARLAQTATLFTERGVEGVILVNTPQVPNLQVPMVLIGRHDTETASSSLIIDNYAGVFAALRHLKRLGHRKIAFMRGHEGSVDSADRWEATKAAARQLGLRVSSRLVVRLQRLDLFSVSPLDEGAACAERLMPSRGQFSALLAFNDMSALGAINRLRAAGWAIPEELSVVGFDDIMEARIGYPALTTVRQPLRTMGQTAAREVIRCITSGSDRQTILFTPELILRDSTAAPPIIRNRRANPAPGDSTSPHVAGT